MLNALAVSSLRSPTCAVRRRHLVDSHVTRDVISGGGVGCSGRLWRGVKALDDQRETIEAGYPQSAAAVADQRAGA